MKASHIFPGAFVYEHNNWGYPYRGSQRRFAPRILEGAHITGNSSLPSALAEMKYSARAGSGASFTFCINRNGTIVQGFDPFLCAPWTNGDLNRPDTSNPIIRSMVGSSFNPNEFCLFTVEHVGYEPGSPLTAAQMEASGHIADWAADIARREFGWTFAIDRITIIGHRQINSVTRAGCPTSGNLNALKDRIISAAQGDDETMDAHPATFHRRSGTVRIEKDVTYNAFRFLGMNADGTPRLKRFNGLKYGGSTSASVIGLAHWEPKADASESYLVTPYLWLPGHGWQPLVWWSRDPAPPPAVTWDSTDDGVNQGHVRAAADEVRDAGVAALNAAAKKFGA